MPDVCIGGPLDPSAIPGMARDMWDSYGLKERDDWAKEALLKGFTTGFDALLSASYLAYERQP